MICRICQYKMERDLDTAGRVIQPKCLKHLETCERCRKYALQLERLNDRLESAFPELLTERDYRQIETAVRSQLTDAAITRHHMQGTPSPRRAPLKPFIRYAAAVAITALGSWFMLSQHRRAHTLEMLARFADGTRQLQTQTAMLLTPEQSLHTEFRNLLLDAKNAAAFIRGCTPTDPMPFEIPDEATVLQTDY